METKRLLTKRMFNIESKILRYFCAMLKVDRIKRSISLTIQSLDHNHINLFIHNCLYAGSGSDVGLKDVILHLSEIEAYMGIIEQEINHFHLAVMVFDHQYQAGKPFTSTCLQDINANLTAFELNINQLYQTIILEFVQMSKLKIYFCKRRFDKLVIILEWDISCNYLCSMTAIQS